MIGDGPMVVTWWSTAAGEDLPVAEVHIQASANVFDSSGYVLQLRRRATKRVYQLDRHPVSGGVFRGATSETCSVRLPVRWWE